MKKLTLIIISLILVQSSLAASFYELKEIPYDSANIVNMKIWFPVKAAKCKVSIRILDKNNMHVRQLVKQVVRNGYYNIYWDKKDDSGKFVEEGNYKTAIIACDYKRLEPIRVHYADGEKSVLTTAGNDSKNPSIDLTLLQDSLYVSLDIVNNRMNLMETLFKDSLIVGEKHTFTWTPKQIMPNGKYFFKLKVNNFEHLIPFKYKK